MPNDQKAIAMPQAFVEHVSLNIWLAIMPGWNDVPRQSLQEAILFLTKKRNIPRYLIQILPDTL
jgi:hypothetical protein